MEETDKPVEVVEPVKELSFLKKRVKELPKSVVALLSIAVLVLGFSISTSGVNLAINYADNQLAAVTKSVVPAKSVVEAPIIHIFTTESCPGEVKTAPAEDGEIPQQGLPPCRGNLKICKYVDKGTDQIKKFSAKSGTSVGDQAFCNDDGQLLQTTCGQKYQIGLASKSTESTYCPAKSEEEEKASSCTTLSLGSGSGKSCCSDTVKAWTIGTQGENSYQKIDQCCTGGQTSCPINLTFAKFKLLGKPVVEPETVSAGANACANKEKASHVSFSGVPALGKTPGVSGFSAEGRRCNDGENQVIQISKDGLGSTLGSLAGGVVNTASDIVMKTGEVVSDATDGNVKVKIPPIPQIRVKQIGGRRVVATWLGKPGTVVVAEKSSNSNQSSPLAAVSLALPSSQLSFKSMGFVDPKYSCRFESVVNGVYQRTNYMYYRNGLLFIRGDFAEKYQLENHASINVSNLPDFDKNFIRYTMSDKVFDGKSLFYWNGKTWEYAPSDFVSSGDVTDFNALKKMADANPMCNTNYVITEPEAKKFDVFTPSTTSSSTNSVSFTSPTGTVTAGTKTVYVSWTSTYTGNEMGKLYLYNASNTPIADPYQGWGGVNSIDMRLKTIAKGTYSLALNSKLLSGTYKFVLVGNIDGARYESSPFIVKSSAVPPVSTKSVKFTSPTGTVISGKPTSVAWDSTNYTNTDRGSLYLYNTDTNTKVSKPYQDSVSTNLDSWSMYMKTLAQGAFNPSLKVALPSGNYKFVLISNTGDRYESTPFYLQSATTPDKASVVAPTTATLSLTVNGISASNSAVNDLPTGYVLGGSDLNVNPLELNCGQVEQDGKRYASANCQTKIYPVGTKITLIATDPASTPNTNGTVTAWPNECTPSSWTSNGKTYATRECILSRDLNLNITFTRPSSFNPFRWLGSVLLGWK